MNLQFSSRMLHDVQRGCCIKRKGSNLRVAACCARSGYSYAGCIEPFHIQRKQKPEGRILFTSIQKP